ncbi:MAG TPA: deoxyribonuclease IV [Candidatus Avichristensenella intestinipullorum]|uniref:Probable endonuclease 4 n=1 Tax=Candidatus Avichristensenella intestinipullorum TaxID=2840693 RepID=A0A9D1CJ06_9FIRM|nr:deoxyribonuclease IV [Candidatus Avichristensenella intestinipullorum]
MSYLGSHLSSARGYLAMGRTALAMGADTFAFFLRNPRGGAARAVAPEDILALRALLEEHRFGPLVAHAPYTLNPCGKDPRVLAFARSALAEDLARMELMPGQLYNLHPGSHVGQGPDAGVRGVAATLDVVLHEPMRTTVLLETMSGKGSEVGGTFEELRAVIDRTALGDRLGVCLDTCHVWDAGYDIAGDLDGVLEAFDRALGLSRLRAVHLNDSQYPRGSHKDRHALLGRGCIGPDALLAVACHPRLRHLPFILETPTDDAGHAAEIQWLRERMPV